VAADRSSWPVRRYRLGAEPADDLSDVTSAEERLAVMWSMACQGWALAGRSMPTYDRAHIPMRLVRPGERRDDDA
jgi:hypothetical protein